MAQSRRVPWLAGWAMLALAAAARVQAGAPTHLQVDPTTTSTVILSRTVPAVCTAPMAYNVHRCDGPCTLISATDWIAWVDRSQGPDLNAADTNVSSEHAEGGGTIPVAAGTTYRYAAALTPVGIRSKQVSATTPAARALGAPGSLKSSATGIKV